MKFINYTLAFVSCLFFSSVSFGSVYVGGALGLSTMSALSNKIDGVQHHADAKDTGYKILLGYKILPILALEAQYTDFGKFKYDEKVFGQNLLGVDVNSHSFGAAAVARLPLLLFAPYAKVGMHRWDFDANDTGGLVKAPTLLKSGSGTDVFYGLGADFTLLPLLDLGLEYEQYQLGDNKLDYISATVKFNF